MFIIPFGLLYQSSYFFFRAISADVWTLPSTCGLVAVERDPYRISIPSVHAVVSYLIYVSLSHRHAHRAPWLHRDDRPCQTLLRRGPARLLPQLPSAILRHTLRLHSPEDRQVRPNTNELLSHLHTPMVVCCQRLERLHDETSSMGTSSISLCSLQPIHGTILARRASSQPPLLPQCLPYLQTSPSPLHVPGLRPALSSPAPRAPPTRAQRSQLPPRWPGHPLRSLRLRPQPRRVQL